MKHCKAESILKLLYSPWSPYLYDRNTAWLRDRVKQNSRGKSAAATLATDFPRDVCLTVSRNHTVFLLSSRNIELTEQ